MNSLNILLTLFIFHLAKGDPIMKTKSGPIRGKTIASGKVKAFLGIPYAEPPLGSLRFAKPVPKFWTTIHDATNLPPPCVQMKLGNELFTPDITNMSEDCLYLNVWVPVSKTKDELKTVMLWIHGGGFITGSSSMKIYDGAKLSEYGDVVVVTINYRLGALGFYTSFTEDAPGNVGFHDQVMAIQWIKENAKLFNGDPDNIVLFGESAGAFSVSMHQISPLSKNLFNRVILQSGSAFHPMYSDSNKKLAESSQTYADILNCSVYHEDRSIDHKSVLECLRRIPAQAISDSNLELMKQGKIFLARIGDDFLPERVTDTYREGHFKDSEVLMGINRDEGTLLLTVGNPDLFGKFGEKDITDLFNETTASNIIRSLLDNDLENSEKDDIIRSYMSRVDGKTGFAYAKAASEAIGDNIVTCTEIFQAEFQLKKDNPVYFYSFDHRPSTSPYAEWMGVLHFDEVQYVFGNSMHQEFSKDEEELSRKIINMWTTFAKTGNPNVPGGVTWPRYTPGEFKYFVIDNQDSVGVRPDNFRCEKWRNFFLLPRNYKTATKPKEEL